MSFVGALITGILCCMSRRAKKQAGEELAEESGSDSDSDEETDMDKSDVEKGVMVAADEPSE